MADVDVRVPIGSGCVGVERVIGSPQTQNQPAHNKTLPSRSSRSSVRRWMLVYTVLSTKLDQERMRARHGALLNRKLELCYRVAVQRLWRDASVPSR